LRVDGTSGNKKLIKLKWSSIGHWVLDYLWVHHDCNLCDTVKYVGRLDTVIYNHLWIGDNKGSGVDRTREQMEKLCDETSRSLSM